MGSVNRIVLAMLSTPGCYNLEYLISFLFCVIFTCTEGARVQILNVGENIILEQGVEQNFTCLVVGGELGDGIIWSVGDRILVSRNLVVEKNGGFQQSVTYIPTTEDNEKLITCKSGLQESKARLIIYQLDIL